LVTDPIAVAILVAEALESCGVRYLIGGSLASAISGEPRSTLDVDMVVALSEADIDGFVAALGKEFHSDRQSLRRAVRERSSSNLIHLGTSTKIDLFVLGGTPLDEEQMDRRQRVRVATDPDRYLYVYTAEDILLQKLRWYRLSDETSDRQWRDVLGILLAQESGLDDRYLDRGASRLGVADLLARARKEAQGT
jgi:hypothetical protein